MARNLLPAKPARSSKDMGLTLLSAGLLLHFFLLFILPIVKAPNKLYQVPWPWMAMFHALLALTWLNDMRQMIRKEDVTWIVNKMAWLGIALSIHMLLQAMQLDPLIWLVQHKFTGFKWLAENHMVGLMGNPFQAAAALAVLIPAIAYQKGRTWKIALLASLFICWKASSLSAFGAALIGAVLGLGILQTKKALIAFGTLCVLTLLGMFVYDRAILLDQGRLEIWKQALHHIQRHPILGVGLNQFKLLGIQQTPNVMYEVRWAHNEWVHFATELGTVWAAGLAAYLSLQARKLSHIHPALSGCFASFLLLSFLHIPFHLAPTLAVAGICLSATHLKGA